MFTDTAPLMSIPKRVGVGSREGGRAHATAIGLRGERALERVDDGDGDGDDDDDDDDGTDAFEDTPPPGRAGLETVPRGPKGLKKFFCLREKPKYYLSLKAIF